MSVSKGAPILNISAENMPDGDPVKRVAGKGAGAGMLQNIPLMLEITRAAVSYTHLCS